MGRFAAKAFHYLFLELGSYNNSPCWTNRVNSNLSTAVSDIIYSVIPRTETSARTGSSIKPQLSSATNAACNSNSNVTFGIMLTAMNSGRGWQSQFFCLGTKTGASTEKVSRPITGLQRSHNSHPFIVGRKKMALFFSGRAASIAPRQVCTMFHETVRRTDCVGPILSQI